MARTKQRCCTVWLAFLLFLLATACRREDDPDGPVVDVAWSEWIKANHHKIETLDLATSDTSDLQFLKPLLAGKRLVQLGENGHGVAEFSQAKVRLIKFLHEEMGFDVIAFESNIFECYNGNGHAIEWTAEEMMGRSIYPVWYTEDVLELFRYIKKSKRSPRPLTLAGFDIQYSSGGCNLRPAAFKEAIAFLDEAYAEEVKKKDGELLPSIAGIADWSPAQVEAWRAFYDRLTQWFDDHLMDLVAKFPFDPLRPLVLRQAAWSLRLLIDKELLPLGEVERFDLRDLGMADNVDFLRERLYPGKKIILWAHNLHVYHDPNITGYSMGYWLAQRHREVLYTMGFFMFSGEAAENNGKCFTIDPAPEGTLEAILFQTGADFSFVDMLGQQQEAGNSWMFSEINYMNWGIRLTPMVPRQQYDAIFFVRTVHPPPYIRYYESPNW